jgi:tetratricopeptide (TPR) repeat protein
MLPLLFMIGATSVIAATVSPAPGFSDLISQGRAAFLASDLDRAESAYNEACPADLVATYPVVRAVTCENLLATVDEVRGNLARAEQRFLQAVSSAEQAGVAYQPLYCAKLIDLGEHYHRQGQFTESEAALLRAVNLARKLSAVKPELLPEALDRLGALYSESPQPESGRAPLTEALAIMTAQPNNQSDQHVLSEIAYAHNSLGMLDLAVRLQPEAESNLRDAVSLASKAIGEDHPVTAMYQTNLALVLMLNGQFDRALLLLRRAQFVIESRQGQSSPRLGVIYAEMSAAANGAGKLAQAAEFAERAISILNTQTRPDSRAIAIAQVALATAYLHEHNIAAAEKILPQAVNIQRAITMSPNSLAAAIQLLARLRAEQHNWRAAADLYREAIAIYQDQTNTTPNPAMVPALHALADLLKHNGGSKDEVRALEARARVIQSTLRPVKDSRPAVPQAAVIQPPMARPSTWATM